MNLGYDQALYLRPFDHRYSYVKRLFKLEPPLTAAQAQRVCDSKQLIEEGFIMAIETGLPRQAGGILVDEQFGADILRDPRRRGFVTALSTEQSGSEEFDFEYDVWKVEGLARCADCRRMVDAARCHGRDAVGWIVLGGGADATQVRHWLATAAGVPGFIGFAVGRMSCWDAVVGWKAQTKTRSEAVAQIAARLLKWVGTVDPVRFANATDTLAGATP